MNLQNISPILLLPGELIAKILLNIPDLKNIKYMSVNKNFLNTIQLMFNHYEKLYDSIDKKWKKREDFGILLKTLFLSKNDDAIIFLFNNYRNEDLVYDISYYIGLFNYTELSHYISEIDFYALADGAAEGGFLDLVKYAVSKGADNYPIIVTFAARGGHLDIVKYAVGEGANDFNGIATFAALGGHLHIVKYAVSKGANNFNEIARNAALGGHFHIVEYAVDIKGANDFNGIASNAVEFGDLNIVKYAVSKGANDFNGIANDAAYGGHLHIVEYAVSKGANNFDEIVSTAVSENNEDIVKYIVNMSTNNYIKLLDIFKNLRNIYFVEGKYNSNTPFFGIIVAPYPKHLYTGKQEYIINKVKRLKK